MARYTGAVCRLCRREGQKLYLKGDRCYTAKCAYDRRSYGPGQHGQGRMRKPSEYALQLREKQKVRRVYGILERQMENYYRKAAKVRGITGEVLLQMLECRLDNVVFRLGIGASRAQARQFVMHGHVLVDGRKMDIPSYQVSPGEVISLKEKARTIDTVKANLENAAGRTVPDWLEFDAEKIEGRIKSLPAREALDIPVEEHLIVERYSR